MDALGRQNREELEPFTFQEPGRELERADLRHKLQEVLQQLPAQQRKTFVLHAEAELSYREVADVLGISIGTVMSRLYYARPQVAVRLSGKLDNTAMTSPSDVAWATPPWPPGPELLAAYFDGEFEGRDELALLRQRLEEWLSANPHGRAQLAEHRRLSRLWAATTPPDPAPAAWRNVQNQLERCQDQTPALPKRADGRKAVDVLAGAVCILVAVFLVKDFAKAPRVERTGADDEPFPVASAREVVILQVEGADTGTLVVGELPVQGPLELAAPGDVTLTSVAPAEGDNMAVPGNPRWRPRPAPVIPRLAAPRTAEED